MRRLTFPVAMPYDRLNEEVLTFTATRDDLRSLGEPGFIEGDSYATAGGRDLFWAFETNEGLRVHVQWAESYSFCAVAADPPDPDATVSALRALGLEGLRFDLQTTHPVVALQPGQTKGAVWIFAPGGAHPPPAIFSRKQLADAWLAQTRSSGALYPCALDRSRYEVSKRYLYPENLPPPGSLEAQRFVGTIGERYEYREGRQLDHPNRWQLWRQDTDTTRLMLAEFDERSEAGAEKERLERQGRPATYEVLQQAPPRTPGREGARHAPRTADATVRRTAPRDPHQAVWVFTAEGTSWPTAVFSSKPSADTWLTRNAGSGILQLHSVDDPGPQEFIETSRERYKYREGKQLESWERWRLWRQDDQGNHFIMAEFDERDEADAEMEKMERRGHKQTYWVAPRLTT